MNKNMLTFINNTAITCCLLYSNSCNSRLLVHIHTEHGRLIQKKILSMGCKDQTQVIHGVELSSDDKHPEMFLRNPKFGPAEACIYVLSGFFDGLIN